VNQQQDSVYCKTQISDLSKNKEKSAVVFVKYNKPHGIGL
jgi:hypothetical protein